MPSAMRCLASLSLLLLVLEAALAVAPALNFSGAEWIAVCPSIRADFSSSEENCMARTPCNTEAQCQPGTMCCPSLVCGRTCVTPRIVPKVSQCPKIQFPLTKMSCNNKETTKCSTDGQCPNNMKCCLSRCGMICLDPVAVPTTQKLPEARVTPMTTTKAPLQ